MDLITLCRPHGASNSGRRVACVYPAANVVRDLAGVLRAGNSVVPPGRLFAEMVPRHSRQRQVRHRISPQPAGRGGLDGDRPGHRHSRRRLPGARALHRTRGGNNLLLLPLIVPGIVLGIALYVFHVETEIATDWPILGSLGGLIAGHVLLAIPWTVRLVTASLVGIDPALE